jgi:hypothetical protein
MIEPWILPVPAIWEFASATKRKIAIQKTAANQQCIFWKLAARDFIEPPEIGTKQQSVLVYRDFYSSRRCKAKRFDLFSLVFTVC